MKEQIVDEEIRLIPYYRNDEASLPWYQDADVCKQVDDRDTPYDLELLHRMYDYLCTHGDCYSSNTAARWSGTFRCATAANSRLLSARNIRTGILGGSAFWSC